jgi:hypothetical protein
MPLAVSEFQNLRDDLRTARGLADNAFNTTQAAGASTIARKLRHTRDSIEYVIADLAMMEATQTAVAKQPPLSGGGNE